MEDNPTEAVEEWQFDFHGKVLGVQVEDEESGERWSAEFTSQYIEEITQKAGNYKKFHVFTTMLVSAFNKNSDSVFIDLLTLSDLEILKAKKAGANHPTPALARSETLRRAQQHKRYLILTYTGEFDRVHFPLPLSFEDTPNAIALQKTVRRLREKLKEKRAADLEPASEREKELRQIVGQLRQDNTELRHRLRHQHPEHASNNNSQQDSAQANAELSRDNLKLKRALEESKRALKEAAIQHEALKKAHATELARWKSKLGGLSVVDGDKERDREVERRRQEAQVLDTYKRRVLALERELKLVRMSSGRASTPTSASRQQTVRSSSPVVRNNASRYSSQQSTPPNTSRGRGSRPSSSSHSVTNSWGSHTSSTPNYSPSSSLGRRFDPTAYTKHKHQQHATTPGSHSNTSASRASRRYMDSPESGYSSAGSRTSQNSRRSQNSQNSQKLRANAQIRKAATHTRDPVPASAGKTQGSVRGGGGGSSSGGRKSTTSAVKAHIRGGGLDRGSDRGSDRDSDREDRVSHSKSKSQRSARDREVMQEAVPMKSKSHKPQSDISSNRRRRDAGGGRGGADSSAGEEEEEEMEDREVLLARRRSAQQSQSSAVHSNQHHQNGHKMRFEEDIGDDEEEDRDVLRGGGGGVLRRSADRNTGSSNSNNSQAQPQQLLTNSQTLLRRSAERSAPHTYPNNNSAASAADSPSFPPSGSTAPAISNERGGGVGGGADDLGEIDRRIQALQHYLDSAREGIVRPGHR